MADVSIKIEGLDALTAKFAKFPKLAKTYIGQALDDTGKVLIRYSQQATLATLPQKTGNLRSAFKWETNGMSGQLYVDPTVAPYAIFVNEGTRPHEIRPRNAKMLAFNWTKGSYYSKPEGGGKWQYKGKQDLGLFFAKVVHHPGTKARPFMSMIAAQSTPEILNAFSAAFDRMVAAS